MSDDTKLFDRELGELVQLHRTAKGLSKEDLAASLGLPPAQIERYESGVNRLSVHRYWTIMSTLDQEPHAVLNQLRERMSFMEGQPELLDRSGVEFLASNRGRMIISALAMCDDPEIFDALADLILAIGVHSTAKVQWPGSNGRAATLSNSKPS